MKTFIKPLQAFLMALHLVIFTIMLSAGNAATAQAIRYVKKSATGNGTGDSWENAYTELADALKWAQQNKVSWESEPLRIYVAKGTYKPLYKMADTNADGVPTTARDNAFVLVKNVQLYGGFDPDNGISNLDNQRIFSDNGTILSGDLDGNDATDVSVSNLLAHETRADNAYRVVLSAGDVGSACLDGFTIAGGNGNKDGNYLLVNGQNVYPAMGSGMANFASSPKLTNLTVRDNAGRQSGGGIYNWGSYPQISNSTITRNWTNQFGGGISETYSQSTISNVVISYNSAYSSGGGLHTGSWASVVSNVAIHHNYAASRGGGIYNEGSSEFKNVTVTDNTMGSTGVGGGVHNSGGEPRFMNVTISRNSAVYYTAGVYTAGGKPKFFNSIIWGNTLTNGTVNNIYKISGAAEFQYNLIQGSAAWKANWGSDLGNNIDGDPLFVDAPGGNYTLSENSPAVNAGSNAQYQSAGGNLTSDKDLSNQLRVRGSAIDMGAFEVQKITYSTGAGNVLYVNKNVQTADGNGSSWGNAISELADALKWAKQNQGQWSSANPLQIWVATGTYRPMYSPADANFGVDAGRDNAFLINDFIQLYGGFDGSESTISQRNWVKNPVILTGASGSSETYLYHVLISAGSPYIDPVQNALVDGFTIRDGNANGVGAITVNGDGLQRNVGGGLLLYGSLMSVSNCIVTKNSASTVGGGFYLYSAEPVIKNVVIHENYAEKMGSAILAAQVSLGTIVNTTCSNNTTASGSYDVNLTNAFITIKNSVFRGTPGLAIRLSDSLSLYNSYFQGVTNSRGDNNLDGTIDPGFTDPANGDFSLKNTSPLIDQGNNGFYPNLDANSLDIASNKRVFNYENGGKIDVGAYEFQSVPEFPVRFVREGYSGDGHTWATASGDLQAMINESSTGNQIWVAGGTYKPNRKMTDANTITPDNAENTYLLKEGVSVYGGFQGNETQIFQRNWNTHETILSGRLESANAYHVVVAAGSAEQSLSSNTKLDGFTVTGGNANNTANTDLNGQAIVNVNGGGIYNYRSAATFSNINVTNNNAKNLGGGVFNWSSGSVYTNMTATGNVGQSGGAVGIYDSNPVFLGAQIKGNNAVYGGGFYILNGSPNIAGALVSGNTADFGGGFYNGTASPVITNATISANTGYAIYNVSGVFLQMANSVVSGNDNGVYAGTTVYMSSLVQGVAAVGNNNMDGDIDPLFVNPSAPGLTTTGDFSLQPCSPLINAGNLNYVPAGLVRDAAGNTRIVGSYDIGAYEYQFLSETGINRLATSAASNSIQVEAGKIYRVTAQGDACRSIAIIQPGGASSVTGQVTLTTWVDQSLQSYKGAPYVQRHYELTPTSNAEAATATITLYFTQDEFTTFNTSSSSGKLPASPGDAAGKSALRIFQYHGIAKDGNGPGAYAGAPISIDPSDTKIVWNTILLRWEVTFDVTGFSGFFAGSQASPLPVKLVSFEGKLDDKQSVDLRWVVAEQSGILAYAVEYSADARNFSEIGRVAASQSLTDYYQFEAKHAFTGSKAYYRLHILEAEADSYSRIISVDIAESARPIVYPMPARDFVWLKGAHLSGSEVVVVNIQGRAVKSIKMLSDQQQIDISGLQPGLYFLQLPFGTAQKIVKQ